MVIIWPLRKFVYWTQSSTSGLYSGPYANPSNGHRAQHGGCPEGPKYQHISCMMPIVRIVIMVFGTYLTFCQLDAYRVIVWRLPKYTVEAGKLEHDRPPSPKPKKKQSRHSSYLHFYLYLYLGVYINRGPENRP